MKSRFLFLLVFISQICVAQSGEGLATKTKRILPNPDLVEKIEPAREVSSTGQIYQVVYEVSKMGRQTDSASVVTQAFKKGIVSSKLEDGSKASTFNVLVRPVMSDTLSVDYRLQIVDGKRTFELAKTGVPFVIGSPEKNQFHDSNGDSFDLKVTVIRK